MWLFVGGACVGFILCLVLIIMAGLGVFEISDPDPEDEQG